MTTMMLVALLIAAPPETDRQPTATAARDTNPTHATPQTRGEWDDEVTAALRGQALAKEMDQPQAVVRLVALHQSLLQDTRLAPADRGRLRRKLRQRLLRVSDQVAADLAHRTTKIETVRRRAKVENRPDKLKKIETDVAILAQWAGVLGQIGGVAGGGAAAGRGPKDLDYGEELVELIQRVIAPNTWDVQGGPSSIVYFQGHRVLVISTTTEVHHQLAGLVHQLRRAGQ